METTVEDYRSTHVVTERDLFLEAIAYLSRQGAEGKELHDKLLAGARATSTSLFNDHEDLELDVAEEVTRLGDGVIPPEGVRRIVQHVLTQAADGSPAAEFFEDLPRMIERSVETYQPAPT